MKITAISIHPLNDPRIAKHLRTLRKFGYEVEYINVSDSDASAFEICKLTHLKHEFDSHNLISVLRMYSFVARSLRKSAPDVIHIHDIYMLPLLLLKGKSRFVFDRHERFEDIDIFSNRVFTRFEKYFIEWINGGVCVSADSLDYLRKIGYKNLALVPNYPRANTFDGLKGRLTPDRKTIGLIYIGSLATHDRNINLLLELYEMCLASNLAITCTLGGKILEETTAQTVRRLQALYPNRFRYLGYCPYHRVVEETLSSDIGLLFFKQSKNTAYSSPNKLFEYLMAGLYFIGVGEFVLGREIRENACGDIFEYKVKAEEIFERIKFLAEHREVLEQARSGALAIGQKYTWESVENHYRTLYEEIVSENE